MDRHLAVVCLPATGHVLPVLPTVAELVRRGWRVSVATGESFAADVARTGATLVATVEQPRQAPAADRPTTSVIAGFLTALTDDARANVPVLQRHFAADPPRAVCYDNLGLTGRVLAATSGAADVALLPSFAVNEHSSPFARAAAGPPPPEVLAAVRARDELLAGYGVAAPTRPGTSIPASLNIVYLPADFQPAADTFDASFRFVGPSPASREDADGWVPPEEPVLLVSLGTAFNDRPEFYRTCVAAFADAGPVAMAVGDRVQRDDLGPLPANVDVRPWFPQPAVLRHARAFVSHAGMGSTMEALYYGVPLVCVPQMIEQEVNAARVVELGLGRCLDPATLTPEGLRGAVESVATDPAVRAALDRMRVAVRDAGGAVAAADAIEAHLAG